MTERGFKLGKVKKEKCAAVELIPPNPWKDISIELFEDSQIITSQMCQTDGSILFRVMIVKDGVPISVSLCLSHRADGGLVKAERHG